QGRPVRRAVLAGMVPASRHPIRPLPLQRRTHLRTTELQPQLLRRTQQVMRLLTLRTEATTGKGTLAVRQDGDTLTEIPGFADVGELLADPNWEETAEAANGATHALDGADLAAVVPAPGK